MHLPLLVDESFLQLVSLVPRPCCGVRLVIEFLRFSPACSTTRARTLRCGFGGRLRIAISGASSTDRNFLTRAAGLQSVAVARQRSPPPRNYLVAVPFHLPNRCAQEKKVRTKECGMNGQPSPEGLLRCLIVERRNISGYAPNHGVQIGLYSGSHNDNFAAPERILV